MIPESIIPPLPTTELESGWGVHIFYDAAGGSLAETMDFLRAAAPVSAGFSGFLPELNHADDGADAGVFNPSAAFPGDPNPGAETDNIKMIAHARIVAPADGEYTIQLRTDDGFLLRWVNPLDLFHSVNGGGQLHPNSFNEVFFPTDTGDSNTRVTAFLTEGPHDVLFAWWEGAGGSHFEISSAPGVVPNDGPAFQLLTGAPSATNLYLGRNEPAPFRITEIIYNPATDEITLTWLSEPDAIYSLFSSADLQSSIEVDDGLASDGSTTTYGPFPNPISKGDKGFFFIGRQ